MDILMALSQLDPADDANWTSDGLPVIAVVAKMTGNKDLKRADITDADPEFNRAKAEAMRAEATEGNEANAETETEQAGTEAVGPSDEPVDPEAEDLEAMLDAEDKEEADAYKEMSMDDLLKLEIGALASYENILAFIARANDIITEVHKRQADENKLIKLLSRRVNLADRIRQRVEKKTKKDQSAIKDYLAASRKAREDRAARARVFLEGGTTAQDVAKQLDSRSQIDKAMNARKAVPGQTRPSMPVTGLGGN